MKIISIVAICQLSQRLDLDHLSKSLENLSFPPKGKTWLKMRLLPENHYVSFYKSGKFLIAGMKSLEKITKIADRIISLLNEAGFDVKIINTQIVNIVILEKIHSNTSLEKIICNLDVKKASFEPEQFPGLIYKDWGVTFLLFSSGKVIITGVKDLDIVQPALKNFSNLINKR